MKLYIPEILEEIKKANDEKKLKLLKEHDSVPLRTILKANYSLLVKFLLPADPAPYKPNELNICLCDTNLYREARRLYLFVEGGHQTLNQIRREQLWIQLLESLNKDEANLLEIVKNRNLEKEYNLSRKIVEQAYPDLLEPLTLKEDKQEIPKVKKPRKTKVKKAEVEIVTEATDIKTNV